MQRLSGWGAFTAIADDTSAAYWNPAGLVKNSRVRFSVPNAQVKITSGLDWHDVLKHPPTDDSERIELLKKLGSGESKVQVSANLALAAPRFAAFVQPFGEATLDASGVTFSGDYPAMGSTATIRGTGYLHAGIGLAKPLGNDAAIGLIVKSVRLKNYTQTIQYTDAFGNSETVSEVEEDKSGLGLDVGYMRELSPTTTFGAVVRNLVRPSIGSISPNRQVNVGIAQRLMGSDILLAADVNDLFDHPNVNLGAQFFRGRPVELWAGVYQRKPTLGMELKLFGARLQLTYSPENKSIVSGSLEF